MNYAPDKLHAVYRYIYKAYSPVVDVTVDVERGDGQPIEWNELHFLHLSRQDQYYTHFVTGEPMTIIPMREKGVKGPGIGAEDWALLSTNDEAMGVSGHRLSCWDASDEFVYYVSHSRQMMSVGQNKESRSGSMYFGPASDDNEWFTRWLGKDAKLKIEAVNGGAVKAQFFVGFDVPNVPEGEYMAISEVSIVQKTAKHPFYKEGSFVSHCVKFGRRVDLVHVCGVIHPRMPMAGESM